MQERRECRLLNKTLRCAAAETEYSGHARVNHDIHHIEHVLNDVEHEVVLLLETCACDPDGEATVGNRRTEDRHSRFVSGSKHAVLGGDLGQFAAKQMQELARRVSTCLIELVRKSADPLLCLAIFFITGKQVPHAADLRRLQLRVSHRRMSLEVITPESFV